MKFNVIMAMTTSGGLGHQGTLPWTIPEDLLYFYQRTTAPVCPGEQNVVIMGRKTWLSLPTRPLPKRLNLVVTSQPLEGVMTAASLEAALELVENYQGKKFVIGGAQLIKAALTHPACRKLYLTRIEREFICDTVLSLDWMKQYRLTRSSSVRTTSDGISYLFQLYQRSSFHPEQCYLDLVKKVLTEGQLKSDRTGTGTLSLFGQQLTINLEQGFPLLTTKKVFWKGVVAELLFFLRAQTHSKILSQQGVKIWDGHGSQEHLRSRGLDRPEGDLGPIYGYQWRHWGGSYPEKEGIDQLQQVITRLRADPDDRRHLVSAWNVSQLDQMALPPCHVLYQFYVGEGKLSCQVYQRSADVGLGLPLTLTTSSRNKSYIDSSLKQKTPEKHLWCLPKLILFIFQITSTVAPIS